MALIRSEEVRASWDHPVKSPKKQSEGVRFY